MTRSYKMLVLRAMLDSNNLPGQMSIDELTAGVVHIAKKSAALQTDIGVDLDDAKALTRLLENNPIAAWTGGRGTRQRSYFNYSDGKFATSFSVDDERRELYRELVAELVDWRLIEYLDRPAPNTGKGEFVCKVSHAADRPILFLPARDNNPQVPSGWTPVIVDGQELEANFVKVAVNVMREPGRQENLLPAVLHNWFGEDAGKPGTSHRVVFSSPSGQWMLTPVTHQNSTT